MANRFTNTEKWKNSKFRKLSPNTKLTLWYLFDNVDGAGFLDWDVELAEFYTGLTTEDLNTSIKELTAQDGNGKSIAVLHNGEIWIPGFLESQSNNNLNSANNAHRSIIKIEETRWAKNWSECPQYVRPLVKMANKTRCSLNDVRNQVYDWESIKRSCLGKMPYNLRDGQLGQALSNWWDHCFSNGKPMQVPAWRQFCVDVQKHSPEVIVEAINWAIGQNMATVNFRIASKINKEERKETRSHHKPTLTIPEPSGWKELWPDIYPNADLPPSWSSLPSPTQKTVNNLICSQ